MHHTPSRRIRRRRSTTARRIAGLTGPALLAAGLAGCSSDDGGAPTLTWYVNPDGQATLQELVKDCSSDA